MPCQSDYLEPNGIEIEHSRVEVFLEEIKSGVFNKQYLNGTHPLVYNRTNKKKLDESTAELCSLLTDLDVTKYSLELQIWWRDHKEADQKRQLEKEKYNKNYLLDNLIEKFVSVRFKPNAVFKDIDIYQPYCILGRDTHTNCFIFFNLESSKLICNQSITEDHFDILE